MSEPTRKLVFKNACGVTIDRKTTFVTQPMFDPNIENKDVLIYKEKSGFNYLK